MVGSSSTGDGRKVNKEPGTIHGDVLENTTVTLPSTTNGDPEPEEAPEITRTEETTVTLPSTTNEDEEPTTTRQNKVRSECWAVLWSRSNIDQLRYHTRSWVRLRFNKKI